MIADVITVILVCGGGFFFFAGTVGILRFPDYYTRLHVMTKADNVGLGLISLGLALQAESATALGQIFIVWFLVLLSGASASHLFARSGLHRGIEPWRHR